MTERWLSTADAEAAVKNHTGSSIGRSQKILRDALESGEVRRHGNDPVLLRSDDGVVGMSMRPGAEWISSGISADGQLVRHRVPRASGGGEQCSENDLLDWLTREHGPSQVSRLKSKGGRRARADWDAVSLALGDECKRRGFPQEENDDPAWRRQADVERWVAELLDERNEPIGESQVRDRVVDMLKHIKADN